MNLWLWSPRLPKGCKAPVLAAAVVTSNRLNRSSVVFNLGYSQDFYQPPLDELNKVVSFFCWNLVLLPPQKKKRCFNHPCIHEVGVKLVALLKVLSCRASFWPNYSQSGTYWTSSTSISVGTKWSRNDKSDNTIDVTYTIEKKRKPSKHVYISIYFPGFIIWSYKKSTKDHPHPKAGNILMTSTFAEMSKPQISTKTKGETLGNQETMDLMLEMSIDRLRCLHD